MNTKRREKLMHKSPLRTSVATVRVELETLKALRAISRQQSRKGRRVSVSALLADAAKRLIKHWRKNHGNK